MLELTPKEANVIVRALQGHHPPMEDEMIAIMLYNRLLKKIAEAKFD